MPMANLQRRLTEIGRIRTGQQVDAGGGRTRPAKLETFRLTSHERAYVEAAAAAFGGDVRPWSSPDGPAWEVVTRSEALDIIVPPGDQFSQWWELWSGGGCQRRCDGIRMIGGALANREKACACPDDPAEKRDLAANGKACKPTTRLNVLLPELVGLGVWRLEVHGYYAAAELGGMADFLAQATARGVYVRARLRLEQRSRKVEVPDRQRPGQTKIETRKYGVPVIDLPAFTPDALLALTQDAKRVAALDAGLPVPDARMLGAGSSAGHIEAEPRALTPGAAIPVDGGVVIAPATAQRPTSRGSRVPRPPLGPAPDAPETSDDFRRPAGQLPTPPAPPTTHAFPMADDDDPGPSEPKAGRGQAARVVQTSSGPADADTGEVLATAPIGQTLADFIAPTPAELVAAEAQALEDQDHGQRLELAQEGLLDPADDPANALTGPELRGMLGLLNDAHGGIVTPAFVRELSAELWPDVSDLRTLTDQQRGALYLAIAARMPQEGANA